jgi:small subunit ribosomal protein S6
MNRYETVFIITPLLTEEQVREVGEKFRNFLTENGASLVNEENWGLRKLAYPIEKKSTGFYHLFEMDAEPDLVQRLEIEYRRDERILRFLIVKLDKYAIEFNERRRKGEFRKKKESETQTSQ